MRPDAHSLRVVAGKDRIASLKELIVAFRSAAVN